MKWKGLLCAVAVAPRSLDAAISSDVAWLRGLCCLSWLSVRPVKTAEPIEMPRDGRFVWAQETTNYILVLSDARYRIRSNDPCVETMQPYVKLL